MPKAIKDIGASVRARLLNLSKERKQPFELLLTRYVLERFLYRLSQSAYRDRFVLKGAMLTAVWFPDPLRPTRDLDLLGFGEPSPEAMVGILREVCAIPYQDGVDFDMAAVRVDRIRDELEYGGQRLRTIARLAGARVHVVIDIGFGDAIEPAAEEIELPVLLDLPAPRLRAYPKETVIAEKLHAMVQLGLNNSRLKDYYDIWVLSRSFDFDDERLAKAIAATFARRKTPLPEALPPGLSAEFAQEERSRTQWAVVTKEAAADPGSLDEVLSTLGEFLMPKIELARSGGRPRVSR